MSIYINGFTRDKVMQVIRKENLGKKSSHDYTCSYRNPDGNKCLVGCFIPDDKYDELMESKTVDLDFLEKYNLKVNMPLRTNIMERLQKFHDRGKFKGLTSVEFFKKIEDKLIAMEVDCAA